MIDRRVRWFLGLLLLLAVAGCQPGGSGGSRLPPSAAQPLAFKTEVIRFEPTPTPTATPEPSPTPTATNTPDRPLSPTPGPTPSDTPLPTATFESIFGGETAGTERPPTPTVRPQPTDPPRRGGSWDMEDGFVVWNNPYGDDCAGAKIAAGWRGFTSRGAYGSSCFVQNEYAPNVHSGRFSQEITFDFVDSHAGMQRTIETKPGHRYRIVAHLKHVASISPLEFHLGVDLSGGTDWQADSVQWFPWDSPSDVAWAATEETVTARGGQMTIFIKGFHPNAEQGGATYVDDVSVTDLGP